MKNLHHIVTAILSLCFLGLCAQISKDTNNKQSINGFPVGYYEFNKDKAFNFQLNRWYSMGYLHLEDIERIGPGIKSFEDWRIEMLHLANSMESIGDLMQAAFYYRAAEFFITEGNPEKERMYKKFKECFYSAVDTCEMIRAKVPYQGTFIQALKLQVKQGETRGTILIHGGFDSFKEELYSMMKFFQEEQYEVITFETPWMGDSRREKDMGLQIQWEQPVGAVLDYFDACDVTLIGISMGGWLSLRAAAYEPRIKRVIASSVSYDVNKYNGKLGQKIANYLFEKNRDRLNNIMLKKMKKDLYYDWFVNHLMYVTNKDTPVEAFDVLREFTAENLHSDLVKQDVLILTGKEDHMVPFKMHAMQVEALSNANSVTERIFTKEECGQNHCQIGNIGLALNVMLKWIENIE